MNPNTKFFIYELVKPLLQVWFYGNARFCPVCQSNVRVFKTAGVNHRPDIMCPVCRTLERHRLIWTFFEKFTNLFDSNKKVMLHIAPEYCFQRRLNQMQNIDYLTADLFKPSAMVKMDITNIQYPDKSFDVIYCSHVLEHVLDDRKAMSEFHRVLKDQGWAVLQVPLNKNAPTTYEDPSITDPKERTKAFGQPDHVRVYGQDYEQRLIDTGFNVKRIEVKDIVSKEEIEKMRLRENEDIFLCTKS
ncbi:class I SAM-dependent methyltransferase [Nostocaceae cyanobacterium CENA357]|uniref:Class I SAM-dependent methyltransferase n=1 Tax=Atlanticothrix silvestris CENA357 TaxID=1725252 RepID=A0A8J7HEQ1_9CYAN|nr:class I SAM-dependent methyltransferase [Atlanticothrix silvestris]MBH8551091.1 class I SAM-dependent methyltransferase [Atlanticothrix silvestris CENA357]